MTKVKYMALADFQYIWSNSIKPWILVNILNVGYAFDENAQATITTQPSVTAGAATKGKIYLVGPSSGTKYEWITLEDDSTTPSTYSWLNIGSTEMNFPIATEQNVRNIVRDYLTSS